MKSVRPTAACSALILIIGLVLDTVPRFALGDSGAYLSTQIDGYMPEDRSWAYGLLATCVTRLSRDLSTVAIGQILLAWGSAILLASALVRYLRLDPWLGVAAVLVLFANPLSFFWARSFMTDALAAAAFATLATLLLASRGTIVTALGVFALAFVICALRSVYLPPLLVAFGMVAVAALVRSTIWRRGDAAADRRSALRFAALSAAVILAWGSYSVVNSRVLGNAAISANYGTTRFLVSAWSPLMGPPLAALDLPPRVTDGMVRLDYDNRLFQAFADDGIVERLRAYYGTYEAADPTYSRLLKAAALENPLGLATLLLHSWSDYINPDRVLQYHQERRFSGTNNVGTTDTLSPALVARLESWHIWQGVSPLLPQVPSFGLSYFADAGGYWALLIAIHATLAGPIYLMLPRRLRSDDALAIQLFAFAYMAMIAMTSNELVTRYLIPLAVPLLITLGLLLGRPVKAAAGYPASGELPLRT